MASIVQVSDIMIWSSRMRSYIREDGITQVSLSTRQMRAQVSILLIQISAERRFIREDGTTQVSLSFALASQVSVLLIRISTNV